MSNKILAWLLVGIVVLLAGGLVAWRLTIGGGSEAPVTDNQNKTVSEDQNIPINPSQNMDKENENSTAACQRDFDVNKLQTAKVDIKNRQVELDVKGFGKVTVELYDKDAPKTVENFLRLVNSGYYDCVTFHRVAKGFVIQGGDPTGTGSGGDSAFGGPFADELNPDTPSYKAGYVKGVLAMANAGPNTNTSQFFIMLGDVPLPHDYTIFGKVVAGQDVVDRIGQVDITPQMGPNDGKPKAPVVIESAKIVK